MTRTLVLGLIVTALAACGGASARPELAPATGAQGTAALGGEAEAGNGGGLRLVRVAAGLDSPVYVTAAPGDAKRLYVVEQPGRIRTIAGGRIRGTFLDIRSLVSSGGERGLLSVAFHPDYAANRRFYVNYTDVRGDTRVVEYRSRRGSPPVRVRELLYVDQPHANHNGGQLQFGPDGLLYVGMGDGGPQNDPQNRSQDLAQRLGKLLRIDVDVPRADWELVAYGLRNPWRFSFDRLTGDLYIGDVGQYDWEEIDFTPAESPGLENYGWSAFEGSHEYKPENLNPAGNLVAPIYEYDHGQGCVVTGGYVYRGRIASARGRYFLGDYCTGQVWSFVQRDGRATDVRSHPFRVSLLTSFGVGLGALYLVSHEGRIFRLAAA